MISEIFLLPLLLSIVLIVLAIIDLFLFEKSPWPERTKYGIGPGSGFVAFWNLVIKKKKNR